MKINLKREQIIQLYNNEEKLVGVNDLNKILFTTETENYRFPPTIYLACVQAQATIFINLLLVHLFGLLFFVCVC